MEYNLNGLKQAYQFYQKVKSSEGNVETGAWKDAEEWIFKELDELFGEEDE